MARMAMRNGAYGHTHSNLRPYALSRMAIRTPTYAIRTPTYGHTHSNVWPYALSRMAIRIITQWDVWPYGMSRMAIRNFYLQRLRMAIIRLIVHTRLIHELSVG